MIESWKDIVTVALGLFGFAFGLYQYWISQRLAKAKFSADLTDKIYQDEELRAAWNFIDSSDRDMLLPAKYSSDGKTFATFSHQIASLNQAMSMFNREISDTGYTELKVEYRKSPYVEYVALFDRLFSFFESIYGYHESKSIEMRHIPHVLYMLNRIDQISFENKPIFEDYLVYYKYDRVLYLIEYAKMYLAENKRFWLKVQARERSTQRILAVQARLRSFLRTHVGR